MGLFGHVGLVGLMSLFGGPGWFVVKSQPYLFLGIFWLLHRIQKYLQMEALLSTVLQFYVSERQPHLDFYSREDMRVCHILMFESF